MPNNYPDWETLDNWLNNDEDDLPFCDADSDDDSPYEFDCGFVPGYGCQLAGTEDCDFDCPYRDELYKHPDYPNVTLSPIANIIAAIALTDLKQIPFSYGDATRTDHEQEDRPQT